MVLFNLSGHTPPDGSNIYDQIYNVTIPNISLEAKSIIFFAKKALSTLPQEILERGDFEIILPGMTPLAATVLAMIHGQYGQFPIIRYALKAEGGMFKLSEPIDLQEVRVKARGGRQIDFQEEAAN